MDKKAYIGVGVSILCGALSLAGGVGEREDDGPIIQLAHFAQDRRRKRAADRCRACSYSKLYFIQTLTF